jgi:hypothetical protein
MPKKKEIIGGPLNPLSKSPGWVQYTYRIKKWDSDQKTDDEYYTYIAQGQAYRGLGVRESEIGKTYEVDSLTTGFMIIRVSSEADAKLIAEECWNSAHQAFKEYDRDKVQGKSPKWMKLWLKQCKDQASYVDPEPFRGAEEGEDEDV